jgi:hypothetical protein
VGGVHRFANVWINGVAVGGHDGFATPFRLDVTKAARPGSSNTITICVDNQTRPENKMCGCFNYYHDWGGIYRGVFLEAMAPVHIENVFVQPNLRGASANFRVRVGGEIGMLLQPELQIVYWPRIDPNHKVLAEEWRRLLVLLRNHPSLLWIAAGDPWSRYLFARMVTYLSGKDLAPAHSIDPANLRESDAPATGLHLSGFQKLL